MSVPGVAMIVRVAGMAVTVGMVVRMPGHEPILPAKQAGAAIRFIGVIGRAY
jgi:hypothetical protein